MEPEVIINKVSYPFVVDRQGRYIRSSTDFLRHIALEEKLEDLGLKLTGRTTFPHDAEHRDTWFETIANLANGERSRLVVVRSPPTLQCVLLSHLEGTNDILVHAPLRRACRRDTIDEISQLLGITEREKQVLELVANGHAPKSISLALGTSICTVRTQLKSLFAKTGTKGMRDIVLWLSGLSEAKIVAATLQGMTNSMNAGLESFAKTNNEYGL